jgi:hypothetical protein
LEVRLTTYFTPDNPNYEAQIEIDTLNMKLLKDQFDFIYYISDQVAHYQLNI